MPGMLRGRSAAALDAYGAAMGSVTLLVFAVIVWRLLPRYAPALVLAAATLAWACTAVLIWICRHQRLLRRHPRQGVSK